MLLRSIVGLALLVAPEPESPPDVAPDPDDAVGDAAGDDDVDDADGVEEPEPVDGDPEEPEPVDGGPEEPDTPEPVDPDPTPEPEPEPPSDPVTTPADHAPIEIVSSSPEEPEPNFFAGAFVDGAYGFSNNLPDNHLFRGQLTTPRTGELTLSNATVHGLHEATEVEPWRLELGLQVGAAVDAVYATEPIPGDDNGAFAGPEVFKHVAAANTGVLIRKTKTELRAGLMGSPLGIGGVRTKDNWNYTTTWAANAAPYYLMGGMIEQSLPAGFGIQGWIVNGWQTIADVNPAPSYMVSLFRNRGDWSVTSQVYFGPEGTDLAPRSWRVHWDTQATYSGPRWGIAGVVDFGQDRITEEMGEPQNLWLLGALFVHGILWENDNVELDLAARPELMWDRDGLLFGVPQVMFGETVTFGSRFFDHVLVRLEYRYDRSTADDGFFYRERAIADTDALANTQHTIFLGVVGYYERAFRLGKKRSAK